jgi:hypothetical protein
MEGISSKRRPRGSCQAPTLGSTMHHISIPGSVADTHRSNKIDIKNHTFINNGRNTLQSSYYIAWAIGLTIYIRVLSQRSYDRRGSIPTGNSECERKPLIPIS